MNLRHLLKRDSQRQLQLIETLYYSPNPRSSEELSKITKCTTPALLNDIRSINTQSDYYQIIRENSLYRLELADNATIDVLFSTLINQSMAFKILEAIFFEDCSTLQELSRKLFCSLTTVQSAMKDLQEALGQWKMTVERRPFRLTGNEIAIRHLFFLYFSEKKFVREQTRYSTEFYQFGDAIVRSMITENELPVSIAQYNRLNLNFFISLIRISKGHRITSRNLTSKSIEAPNQHAINNFSPYLRR
ncbi:helix-turn-helix domain-containing protein (plasmid) [Enterococcus sp. 22-H-5-01]